MSINLDYLPIIEAIMVFEVSHNESAIKCRETAKDVTYNKVNDFGGIY